MKHPALAAAALAAVVLTGCVSHPVGPARTFGKYEGKARTSAEAALSAVETARLAAEAAGRDHVFGPYLGQILGEQEESASGTQETFDSIQPPDRRADELRQRLDDLLAAAVSHLGELRIAARRGEPRTVARLAGSLAEDADRLSSFADAG
jgi:hypothetical protein